MSLQKALQEHFETALAPQAAAVDGVAMMGFPGLSDATIGGMVQIIEGWLGDALNADLIPTEEEAIAIVETAFNTFIAPRVGPVVERILLLGLKALVSSVYERIEKR